MRTQFAGKNVVRKPLSSTDVATHPERRAVSPVQRINQFASCLAAWIIPQRSVSASTLQITLWHRIGAQIKGSNVSNGAGRYGWPGASVKPPASARLNRTSSLHTLKTSTGFPASSLCFNAARRFAAASRLIGPRSATCRSRWRRAGYRADQTVPMHRLLSDSGSLRNN